MKDMDPTSSKVRQLAHALAKSSVRIERLTHILSHIEWVTGAFTWVEFCAFCGHTKERGHSPQCSLMEVLDDEWPDD
jgi:hypothetical protein